MQPIVHGLEEKYRGRVTFVYLDIRDGRNAEAKVRFGYKATPHFFLLAADGRVLRAHIGLMSPKDLEAWLTTALGS
jgi:thioredoxin-like negative regulator of GroEL